MAILCRSTKPKWISA